MLTDCKICNKTFKVYPYQLKINKGKYCSLKCCKLGISKTLTGKKQSEETKKKRSLKLKGFKFKNTDYDNRRNNKHYNWKGGITPQYKLIRGTKEWKKWRELVFERDNYTCQKCGSKSGYDGYIRIEAHHIFPVKKLLKYNLTKHIFNVKNGITLCRKCHLITIRKNK